MGYARSPFHDFKTFIRIVVGLDEEEFQLILKQKFPEIVTFELPPGVYSIKDFSEAVFTKAIIMGQKKLNMNMYMKIGFEYENKTYFDWFWVNIWNVKI